MCDIFAISSGYNHTPQKYLPIFAEKGRHNIDGWGIGFFRDESAFVEKSPDQVFFNEQVHESFQRLARIIDSRIIISHINCPKSGSIHPSHRHPLELFFLDHNWLFANIGIVENIENYKTVEKPAIAISANTARIFEYLRDRMIALNSQNPYVSLYLSLKLGIKKLLEDYPGYYAFFLANESVLFAFYNFRSLFVMKKSEKMGDVLMITSINKGLSSNNWLSIQPENRSNGKLLVIAGPDILYAGDIYP